MSIEARSHQYGNVFDHWQIQEFLGSGSGGKTAVFRLARSDSGWGTSALKVINLIEERGDIDTLPDYRRREYEAARTECSRSAEQEVRLMDALSGNTNIVDYLDHTFVDWSDGSSFGRDLLIRMELLKDLRSELREGRQFSEIEAIKIAHDICVALILCHRKNILHRDVKPENIFRNKDGNYKLGDFGVSRVLDACPGAVATTGVGTNEYWPAEQMSGNYDKRVDVYSLGLVLYELCNRNRLPFASSTYATSKDVLTRLAGTPLPPPSEASPALAQVILKACAFDPAERYQSAEAFLKALGQAIRRRQEPAMAAEAPRQPARRSADTYGTVLAAEQTQPSRHTGGDAYGTVPAAEQMQPSRRPDADTYGTVLADQQMRPSRRTGGDAYDTVPASQEEEPRRRGFEAQQTRETAFERQSVDEDYDDEEEPEEPVRRRNPQPTGKKRRKKSRFPAVLLAVVVLLTALVGGMLGYRLLVKGDTLDTLFDRETTEAMVEETTEETTVETTEATTEATEEKSGKQDEETPEEEESLLERLYNSEGKPLVLIVVALGVAGVLIVMILLPRGKKKPRNQGRPAPQPQRARRPEPEEEPVRRRPAAGEEPVRRRPAAGEEPVRRRPVAEEEPVRRRPAPQEAPERGRPVREEANISGRMSYETEPAVAYRDNPGAVRTVPLKEVEIRYDEPVPAAPTADAGETTVLNSRADGGMLIRKRTGEIIRVSEEQFVIGRDRSCVQYCVSGNSSIGRTHARLMAYRDGTYLVDLQSTNGTFVNNVRLVPGQEIRLRNGDRITLANEDFEFRM